MRSRTTFLLIIFASLSLFSGEIASASPLLLKFAGQLEFVYDQMGLDPSIVVGAPFFGSFSYDPAVDLDTEPDPTDGRYYPGGPMTGQLANFAFEGSLDLEIAVANDWLPRHDVFATLVHEFLDPELLASYHLYLRDESGTAFSTDNLPATIALEAFAEREFEASVMLWVDNPPTIFTAYGTVTSLTIVPEPGTLAILAAGALASLGRRRGCQSRPDLHAKSR